MDETTVRLFERRVCPHPSALVRLLENESVVLNLDTEQYFGLDEIGTRIWSVLTTAPTIAAAYRTLLAEYDVPAERLRRDLTRFVQRLAAKGLIELGGP